MCSVKDTEEDLVSKPEHLKKLPKNCVKCGEKALHVVGTNGTFCSDCFKNYFTHKFRASMGKNPIVRNGDNVLLAYSGGISSSALLHLIVQGLNPNATRRLKFVPGIIFVDESCVLPDKNFESLIKEIEEILKLSSFPYHIVKLEEVFTFHPDDLQSTNNSSPSCREKLLKLLSSSSTLDAKLELIYRLRCQLLSFKAKALGYKHVFLGENSTRLAIKILSNVALGRGAHLSQDTGFSDGERFRDVAVNLLRPLRDISVKEIVMYNAIHKVQSVFLPNLATKKSSSSSIPNLTENFIQGLVRNFPSTEMTVYRISNKIRPAKQEKDNKQDPAELKCKLCLGNLDNRNEKSFASARKDLHFTQNLLNGLFGDPGSFVESSQIQTTDHVTLTRSLDLCLCYSCSLIMREIKLDEAEKSGFLTDLPSHNFAAKLNTDKEMRDKLKGILIEE